MALIELTNEMTVICYNFTYILKFKLFPTKIAGFTIMKRTGQTEAYIISIALLRHHRIRFLFTIMYKVFFQSANLYQLPVACFVSSLASVGFLREATASSIIAIV